MTYEELQKEAMFPPIRVGDLRKALEGVPDDVQIRVASNTCADEGILPIVVSKAQRFKCDIPDGLKAPEGIKSIDIFEIYIDYLHDRDGEELEYDYVNCEE